jgi:hypothetical protein
MPGKLTLCVAGLGWVRTQLRFEWSSVAGVFAANEDPFGAAWCSLCTAGYARIEEALIEPADTKKRNAEPYH